MKIQFLDDEIRNHDDRTGKYHNNNLGGAVDEDEDQTTRDPEVTESWRDDLDGWGGDLEALDTGQEEKEEAEALTSVAPANRTLREARAKQHQVRVSLGFFLNNSHHATATPGDRSGSVPSVEDHIGLRSEARRKEGRCNSTCGLL